MNNAEKLWQMLQRQTDASERVPKGFKTIKEWSKDFGKSASTVNRMFDRLPPTKVQRKSFRVRVGSLCRPTLHFKITA